MSRLPFASFLFLGVRAWFCSDAPSSSVYSPIRAGCMSTLVWAPKFLYRIFQCDIIYGNVAGVCVKQRLHRRTGVYEVNDCGHTYIYIHT